MCTGNENCLDTSQIVIPTGNDGNDGAPGGDGNDGNDGQDAIFGGFSARWRFDATTGGAPVDTFLKFDSTVLSSVSSIEINDLNADLIDHDSFLSSFQNQVNSLSQFGLIRIWKQYDSTIFWSGKITDTVDQGTSRIFSVEHIESNGTFLANDSVVVSFVANGADATLDTEILDFLIPGTANTTITLLSLGNIVIPANTLIANGDTIEGSANLVRTGVIPSSVQATFSIGSTTVPPSNWLLNQSIKNLKIDFKFTRISNTTALLDFKSWLINDVDIMLNSYGGYKTISFDNSIPNDIRISGLSADGLGNSIQLESLLIKKFNI